MVQTWMLGIAWNGIAGTAFLAITALLTYGILKTGQWRTNPLAVATAMIFLTCGGGHFVHFLQLTEAALGVDSVVAHAARVEYELEWHILAWDATTAAAGVFYWMVRAKFPALVKGTALYEDLRARERRALEIHDNVVQGLVRAKLALELGLKEESGQALANTLSRSRLIIEDIMGPQKVQPAIARRE